jgi:RIP metalloprotease RseP
MAFLILAVFLVAFGIPVGRRPVVKGVEATLNGRPSPAATAGLRVGDEVVAVDGRRVDTTDDFIQYTRDHVGRPISITVRRGGTEVTVRAAPVLSDVEGEEVGRLGLSMDNLEVTRDRAGPVAAIGNAAVLTGRITGEVVASLGRVFGPAGLRRVGELLSGAPRRASDPTSIVGGAQIAGAAVQTGHWDVFFQLLAVFNVFVGIINLVPLPPLDGGHLAVLAVEKVSGRTVDMRKLVPVTALVAGFMVLLVLSLAFIDITNPIPNPFR